MINIKKWALLGLLASLFVSSSVMAVDACRCNDYCNSQDTTISGKLPDIGFLKSGGIRPKNNAHSIYLKTGANRTVSYGVYVKVVAYDRMGHSYENYGEYNKSLTLDKYGRNTQMVMVNSKNTEYQIKNYVKEAGFDLCTLEFRFQSSYDRNKEFNAYWSPDYCSGYGIVDIADTPSSTSLTAP